MADSCHRRPALIERIPSPDGARIAVKRKVQPNGSPVVFVHGLAVNADLWDLPDVQGRDFHYRSLAALLHEAGCDIWLMNLRGHGAPHMLSEPPSGQDDWCVDHFVLFDLPAVVEHVRRATGQRPVIIAASMGAITLAGYLQGSRLVASASGERIVADAALARQRQADLAGCVFVEFPAALRWPSGLYDAEGRLDWQTLLRDWWRKDGTANFPFEMVSRWGWLQALVSAVGEVPVQWVKGNSAAAPWYRRLPAPLADAVERLERGAVQAMLHISGTFTGATNHRAEVMLRGRRYVFDHMKAGVLRQLAQCVRRRALVSLLGDEEHVYSAHYDLVALPLLVVQGGRDRIANAATTRAAFFEQVASSDKTWLFDEQIAHGEIEAAPAACERLYPAICRWVDAHRGAAPV